MVVVARDGIEPTKDFYHTSEKLNFWYLFGSMSALAI